MSDTTFLITGGFFDAVDSDRLYSADQMNQPYKKLIHDGIKKEADGTTPGFAVSASGGMNIAVATGDAIVGGKWAENKDVQTIEIAGNTSGSARVDSIILQCDKSKEVRAIQIVYRQGTTTAPDLVNNEDITELRIANITVPAAASAIVAENITDTRGGAECPWVAAIFTPTGPQIEEGVGQYLNDNPGALVPALNEAVETWLEEHPEVTTTVQDGSLTEAKFSNALKLKTIKAYVTPEMYGAKGDGVTDDTAAIQAAIDNAGNNSVIFSKLSYKITSPIEIRDKNKFIIDCRKSTITYTGEEYAFILEHIQNTDILIGEVQAETGGCIKCIASDSNNSQYVNIRFKLLYGATDDIFCQVTGTGWFNEVHIYDGRLSGTGNGVRIVNEKTDYNISSWNFINVGFEGRNSASPLGVGVYLDATNENAVGFVGFNFISIRAAESFTKLFYTRGACKGFLIASGKISRYLFDVDSGADGWTIITGEHTDYIKNGMFFDDGAYHFASGANTDLNNVKTPGTYYAPTNAIVSGITNCPVSTAFNLYVYYGALSDRIIQLLETYTGTFVIRYYLTSTSAWSEWTGVRDYSKTIVTNDDLDTFLAPQKYACSTSAIAGSLSHCPVSVSFGLTVETLSGPAVLLQTLVPNQAEPVVYRRIYRNNAWGTWYSFHGAAV